MSDARDRIEKWVLENLSAPHAIAERIHHAHKARRRALRARNAAVDNAKALALRVIELEAEPSGEDIDPAKIVLAQATEQGCWCAKTRKRCPYHDGVEDGMYHRYDELSDRIAALVEVLEDLCGYHCQSHVTPWANCVYCEGIRLTQLEKARTDASTRS